MKKLFIIVITSFSFLFIIWLLQIAIKNNFNVQNIRFSLKSTIMQLQDIDADNFKQLTNNIYYSIKIYEIQVEQAQSDIWQQLALAPSWLGMMGNIILNILKYITAEIVVLFQILNFIFNPITY